VSDFILGCDLFEEKKRHQIAPLGSLIVDLQERTKGGFEGGGTHYFLAPLIPAENGEHDEVQQPVLERKRGFQQFDSPKGLLDSRSCPGNQSLIPTAEDFSLL
jgi:hypothetical protein